MGSHLDEARKIYEEAVKELRGKPRNPIHIRMIADKGWLSAVEAVNDLVVMLGYRLPETHGERYGILREVAKSTDLIPKKGVIERLGARDMNLHKRCFYEGDTSIDLIDEINKLERFLRDIEIIEIELRSKHRSTL